MKSQNLKNSKVVRAGAILLFGAVCAFVSPSFAQDVGVVVGVRSDSADSDMVGTNVNSKTGFQAGVIGKFELSGPIQVRSGMIYVQRAYDFSSIGDSATLTTSYFEVPVGLLYKFSDYGGAFLGPALSFNLSKNCSRSVCGRDGVNAAPLAIQFGASFKVSPQFGFELYYESQTGGISSGTKSARAIAANLMITFD